jgi:hypothetical protein
MSFKMRQIKYAGDSHTACDYCDVIVNESGKRTQEFRKYSCILPREHLYNESRIFVDTPCSKEDCKECPFVIEYYSKG